MSKKCQNDSITLNDNGNDHINGSSFKINEKLLTRCIDIGVSNTKRWKSLRSSFKCKTDEDFVRILLNLAEDDIKR